MTNTPAFASVTCMKNNEQTNLYVQIPDKKFLNDAQNLAKHLSVKLLSSSELKADDLYLAYDREGLSLNCGKLSLREDFTTLLPRVKDEMWKHEMLVKAAKFKNPEHPLTAIDATAGLGEDSLLLAAAGFSVTLFEYNPVIAALLKDALRQAKKHPVLKEMVSRMKVIEGNSIEEMPKLLDEYDVVYLDPMFPERQKSSLIKKKFQLLQKLESPCMEGEKMLNAALQVNAKRIIIKRPAKGPFIADVKPEYSITGKAIRYDCITNHS